jgi:hypothetical protein
VAEVDSGLQQLFEARLWHVGILLGRSVKPRRPSRGLGLAAGSGSGADRQGSV